MPVGPPAAIGGLLSDMVSIGKLATGQADYYLQHAAARLTRAASIESGADDYYLAGSEASGEWLGRLPQVFGLTARVEDDELRRALSGRSPDAGEPLPRRPLRVPGFDVTFSAPKSVSVLFGIADESVRAAVRDAHDRAVREAFDYLEQHSAMSRRGHGGHELVEGEGLLAAAFRHRTSRAGDPQLHTHVLVANVTRAADGVWRALDGRRLYAHAKTASYLYEARLRGELTRTLGVAWEKPRHGIADILGVSKDVTRAFSRRRTEIERELARVGRDSAAAAQVAALETRRRKDYDVTPEALAPEWRRRAARLGLDASSIANEVLGRRRSGALADEDLARLAERLASPGSLTHEKSAVSRRDAIQAWCDEMPPGAELSVEEIETRVDALLRSPAFVPLLGPATGGGAAIRRADGRLVTALPDDRRYTTPDLLAAERRIIARACEPAAAPVATPHALARALAGRPSLAPEQAEMVRRLTTEPSRVSVVVGKAGTGKTFALEAARAAWEAAGVCVTGAAVARRAARELEEGSGIVSTSVSALLMDLRESRLRLRRRSVLVIDEASLVPTRQLDELLHHVVAADAKLVLVGDHRQLPAIQAGGAFLGLVLRSDAIELEENRRQAADWEREALDLLRDGAAREALQVYAVHDRLVIGDDSGAIRDALVRDWWRKGDVGDAVMIAFRRADVRELNARARALMVASGHLGTAALEAPVGQLSVGERVVLRRNDRGRGVANGDRATVVAVEPAAGTVTVAIGEREVRLDRSYLASTGQRPSISYGYAVTGHIAQGMTVDRALVLGTDALFQEWGYVAMSRGRHMNRFYAVAGTPERDEYAPREVDRGRLDDVAAALGRSRGELMAVDIAWAEGLLDAPTEALRAEYRAMRERGAGHAEAAVRELQRVTAALRYTNAEGRLEAELAASRRRALSGYADQLRAVLRRAAPDLVVRTRLVDGELGRRERLAGSARRLVAPPEMLQAIGPRPERPAELERWRRRVAGVDREPGRDRLLVR